VIAPAARVTVADELQGTIVELIDLTLLVTQLAWDVSALSPEAVALRRHFDALGTELRRHCDDVAARMLELGHVPNGQSRTVAIETDLTPLPTRLLAADEARDALDERIGEVTARLTRSGESVAGDSQTAELLAGIRARLLVAGTLPS
jgi:starvation-inducible DNA-binding protein